MKQILIADSLFLGHSKSAFLGGTNLGSPSNFEWVRADAGSARFVTDSDIKHANGRGQVAWLLEPYVLHPENYIEALGKGFDAVLTTDYHFVKEHGWLWYAHGGSLINPVHWGMVNKLKEVCLLMSSKNTLEGHKLRHRVAERYGDQVEAHGLYKFISSFMFYAPYRYSVVIENHRSAWYFTERLIDCFTVGTVPIYWGSPDVELFFNPDGIIRMEDIDDLGRILEEIGEKDYAERLPAVRENLELARCYTVVEDWLYREYPELFDAV